MYSAMTSRQVLPFSTTDIRQESVVQSAEEVTLLGIKITLRSKRLQFIVLCCTVFIFYITYSFIQELMFKVDGMESYGWHLTLIQFLVYSITALLESFYCSVINRRKIPIYIHLQIATFTVGTMGLSNVAVGYLNYPTQVIFKCCKLVPVLIGGIIIQGKRYSCIDFAAACVMSCGLIIFILGDSVISPMFNLFGYAMISTALLFDAIIGNIQEKSLHAYKATTNEVILYSYSIGFVLILLGLMIYGNFLDGFHFFFKHPLQTYGYGILFSICGYVGVNAVLSLVRTQGALTAVTVTTVRKAVTITLSFLFFSKPFVTQYLWGGLLILIAIYLNLYSKNRSSWEPVVKDFIGYLRVTYNTRHSKFRSINSI
uniref:Adenosine 3'-phospho 5'-phosphosulfate transporter 2 n=1 Tax=Elaeophora elaphi TaxID=1147741 RepID=A0A0R3RXP0_9BILA